MSDQAVRAALAQMAGWLADPLWIPDAEDLARWNQELELARGDAERAPGWELLTAQAHAMGAQLEARITVLEAKQDELRKEMNAQFKGQLALKGYKPDRS
jgi:hypothetical protein